MKEKDKVETISPETVDVVIGSIKQAKEEHSEIKDIDTEKIKEVIESLRGCTVPTVASVIGTAFLLLPAGAIVSCLNMGNSALKTKMAIDLMELMGNSEAPTE